MHTKTLTTEAGPRTVAVGSPARGWRFEHCSISGRITATEPDGTTHSVARGDMNTLAGHALLNAMARDLTKPKEART